MSNKMFTSNFVSIPTSVNWYGCIASINDRLFVVGGGDPDAHLSFNYLQVLELKYMNWIDGPTMARKRVRHSCVADTFGLFAIGGYDYESSSPWLTSIETIDINNTTQNSWEIIHNLEESNVVASSVVHNHLIYVMGGRTCSPQPCTFYDTVYIIDTKTKSVTLSNDRLPYDAFEIASTILGGFIYIFGGGNGAGSTPVNEWAYYELPSLSPTNNPSSITPTSNPSVSPTNNPSVSPTNNPNLSPIDILSTKKPTTTSPSKQAQLMNHRLFQHYLMSTFLILHRCGYPLYIHSHPQLQ
eukprot:914900_1